MGICYHGKGPGSKGGATARGGWTSETSAKAADGSTIDLTETPLQYGQPDAAVSGRTRLAVEAQERKRLKAKVEHAMGFDENGNPTAPEKRGGKGSVRTSFRYWPENGVFTHNHPRMGDELGTLGGSFSLDDIRSFNRTKVRTMRASASEGTYSITRGAAYDGRGLYKYLNDARNAGSAQATDRINKAAKRLRAGEITLSQYDAETKAAANAYLVGQHNALIAGQQQYGYTYTLERRA